MSVAHSAMYRRMDFKQIAAVNFFQFGFIELANLLYSLY